MVHPMSTRSKPKQEQQADEPVEQSIIDMEVNNNANANVDDANGQNNNNNIGPDLLGDLFPVDFTGIGVQPRRLSNRNGESFRGFFFINNFMTKDTMLNY
jgi:hypothetical protein